MDISADTLSIKSLLFTKAIPNYVIPEPVNGHRVFACTDCGDKFLFESSYNDHINRKSAKINYNCRLCCPKVFYNRCNLLFHVRSHALKTATINVTDIKIEPLPLSYFKAKDNLPGDASTSTSKQTVVPEARRLHPFSVSCPECKKNITNTCVAYKDRTSHFMQFTKEVYSCPVCLFALPSICALKVHLRLHLKCPPYYCPECGIPLENKNIKYPYTHNCEGFKIMRAAARVKCGLPDCCVFHPNASMDHMKKYHLREVYICPFCVVACFSESTMDIHLKSHKTSNRGKPITFYQCSLCPGRYVLEYPRFSDSHLKSHVNTTIFPCWACGANFKEVSILLTHFLKKHNKTKEIKNALNSILIINAMQRAKSKRIYRVVKKCDQCKRSFTYKCKYEEIQILPNECPYKCTSTIESNVTPETILDNNDDIQITCHICRVKMSQDWSEIKKHYADLHKEHKCLDVEILLKREEVKKYLTQNKIPKTKPNTSKALTKVTKRTRNRRYNITSTSPPKLNAIHTN